MHKFVTTKKNTPGYSSIAQAPNRKTIEMKELSDEELEIVSGGSGFGHGNCGCGFKHGGHGFKHGGYGGFRRGNFGYGNFGYGNFGYGDFGYGNFGYGNFGYGDYGVYYGSYES
jgi:hypothetical protein